MWPVSADGILRMNCSTRVVEPVMEALALSVEDLIQNPSGVWDTIGLLVICCAESEAEVLCSPELLM